MKEGDAVAKDSRVHALNCMSPPPPPPPVLHPNLDVGRFRALRKVASWRGIWGSEVVGRPAWARTPTKKHGSFQVFQQ